MGKDEEWECGNYCRKKPGSEETEREESKCKVEGSSLSRGTCRGGVWCCLLLERIKRDGLNAQERKVLSEVDNRQTPDHK